MDCKPRANFSKGEVLVRLDSRIAKTELEKAQALLNINQQLLADAKLTYEQTQQLFDNLVRSKRELELAEIAYKQAQQNFYAQQAEVKQQQLILAQYQITAPFDLKVIKLITPRNATNHRYPQALLSVEKIQPNNR